MHEAAVIVRRRQGVLLARTSRIRTRKTKTKPPRKATTSNHTIKRPERPDLTKSEWAEYGEHLRVLRRYGYINARSLSLKEARDAVRSIHKCCNYRVIVNNA